jgi:glutamate synthase (NADPH) small chain
MNKSLQKVSMPEQCPDIRNQNFSEVSLGYTEEMAILEAERCLQCKHKPCVNGCPVNVQIPEFIDKIINGDFSGAYQTIKETNSLPAICGRVCPQESQCEANCVRGIKGEPVGIGRLERFVADYALSQSNETPIVKPSNQLKVAVIGAGPAGLSCANDLVKQGYDVTIFEAFHTPGGVLVYGIPEFRLPKSIVDTEIKSLKAQGVKIMTNMVIGKVLTLEDLNDMGFEAIFLGTGAGVPNFLNIEGESLIGVYSANEYLTRINLMKAYQSNYDTPVRNSESIAIIGGGNVAMDAARCAKRLGAKHVYLVYRRSLEEMPARLEEIHHAKEEGIEFKLLTNPIKILGNEQGEVNGMVCSEMELGEMDASGRRRPIEKENSQFILNVDTVIVSIGTSPNPILSRMTPDLKINKWGCIEVNEDMSTSKPGIFAGGDAVTGAATVIQAMGAGKRAAQGIHEYLRTKFQTNEIVDDFETVKVG